MMFFPNAETIDALRLKLCLLALPVYVWPREVLLSWHRRLFCEEQPDQSHAIANATIRWFTRMLSLSQFRAVTSSPTNIYDLLNECPKLQDLNVSTREIIEKEFQATYIANTPRSTHLILYVHGGGFVSGSTSSVSKYLLQLFLELQQKGSVYDILSVNYDLAPAAAYPTALRQVVKAYRYAASLNKPIILMGDSAGGNLCLGLLQHLRAPQPLIEVPADDAKRVDIVAACLLSPWVNLRTEGLSVGKYKHVDCLDKTTLDIWAQHYLGASGRLNCYNSPIERQKNWAAILPKRTVFLAGGMELFLSDILDLARIIREDGFIDLEVIVSPRKGHAWAAVDYGFECASKPLVVPTDEDEHYTNGLAGVRLQADWISQALSA